jgi:hypothetical protein
LAYRTPVAGSTAVYIGRDEKKVTKTLLKKIFAELQKSNTIKSPMCPAADKIIQDFEKSCIDMEGRYSSDPAVRAGICFSADFLRLSNLIRHGFVDTSSCLHYRTFVTK